MDSLTRRVTAVLAVSTTLRPMQDIVADELLGEIERYLEAVALFRALGHEPSWRSEG